MKDLDLQETLRAVRELASASCHLANLSARLTLGSEESEAVRASEAALHASSLAAEGTFALDDALKSNTDPAALLWLSLETMEGAQAAVRTAREAVEVALAHLMNAPSSRVPR